MHSSELAAIWFSLLLLLLQSLLLHHNHHTSQILLEVQHRHYDHHQEHPHQNYCHLHILFQS